LIAIVFACAPAGSQDFSREMVPLAARLETPPFAVPSGGKVLVIHELILSNAHSKSMTLNRVEVLGLSDPTAFEGESLEKEFIEGMPHKRVLPSGQSTALLLRVASDRAPRAISHRISLQLEGIAETLTVELPEVAVNLNTLRISPPLRGRHWIALNGPAGRSHHSGGLMPYRGRFLVPQRYAIDFIQIDERGEMHRGDEKNNISHYCYGAEALAVADGLVADTRDGIPENVPGSAKPAVNLTLDTVTGNRVVLDLGRGQFAHYAHLKPGSLRVRKGDRVRRGQVLGLVGNSGGSTGPHLHFQVSRSAEILKGDGLPYVFDRFTRQGKSVRDEIPRDQWVVDFR